jgi:hypothetical protein
MMMLVVVVAVISNKYVNLFSLYLYTYTYMFRFTSNEDIERFVCSFESIIDGGLLTLELGSPRLFLTSGWHF